jgi:ATP synthase protein I
MVYLTPFKVVSAQIMASLVIAVLYALFSTQTRIAAVSAAIGGAICWMPGALFALCLNKMASSKITPGWRLALGELVKIVFSIILFIMVALLFQDVAWGPLLVTYIFMLKTYWIALAWR